MVQVNGPCRAEWIESLEDSGLQIVQYIHPFTYVVWGDPVTRGGVEGADMVRWTGAFAPAYRVLPKWRTLPETPQRVKVLMYRGADTDAVVREIEGLGAVIERRKALNHIFEIVGFSMPGNALQTYTAVISESTMRGPARRPGMTRLEPRSGQLALFSIAHYRHFVT